jgi:glutathione synthase/RimK-type ligase-like ATP-grasp enzyme
MDLPERDPDKEPLDAALAAAGIEGRWLAWDDPAVDWDAPIPTVVRSTWNYVQQRAAFLAWCARAARAAPFFNPPDLIADNTHKSYLLALAQRGIPSVPTVLVRQDEREPPRVQTLGWERVVIKPAVGAGSSGTRAFASNDLAADAHLAQLARAGDVLIQPYVASIDGHGERSLIWIDGALTHQVRKAPRFAGQVENVTGPFPITAEERALALATLEPWAERLLYARVDLAYDDAGKPRVMEVELSEPSLFFARCPGSADRYVAGLVRRL